jgi:magnesium chelatase family protein
MEKVDELAKSIAQRGKNVVLVGPPTTGKTMIARLVADALGPMTDPRDLKIANHVRKAAGLDCMENYSVKRPFRAPHHTVSDAGLAGRSPDPDSGLPLYGEMSLAHGGVLFLDELPEFRRSALERVSLALTEGGVIHGTRSGTVRYPAGFLFVGAMNPCPCGWYEVPERICRCAQTQITRYRARAESILRKVGFMDLRPVIAEQREEAQDGNEARETGSSDRQA